MEGGYVANEKPIIVWLGIIIRKITDEI